MTKRERAIIMAYTGCATFKDDDIQYFLDYVKEKTGLELNVINWNFEGTPIIDFGSTENIEKIRKACKKDFDDLIRSSNEKESKEKDAERFAKKMITLEKRLGRDLRPDEAMLIALYESVNATEDEKDAENKEFTINGRRNGKERLIFKKVKKLEQRFGRELRPDEVLLLTLFDSITVTETDEKKAKDLFFKKVKQLEQRFGRSLRPSEALLLTLFDSIDIDKIDEKEEDAPIPMPYGQEADLAISLAILGIALGIDPKKELTDELDKMLKAESEKRKKSSSNHEFSDAIAEAALEICGIDLKKEDKDD